MPRHEVRATGTFGSSFGCVMGIVAAVAVVGIGGVLVCAGLVGGCGLFTKKALDDVAKDREERESKEKQRAQIEPRSTAPKEYSRVGFARAKVTNATIQPVEIMSVSDKKLSKDSYLVIALELTMLDDKKRWEFYGWTDGKKLLSDEAGNAYERPRFGVAAIITGELRRENIVAGKPVAGIIVFDPPPPGITEVNLDLPAHGADVDGYFRFKIPSSMWKK